MRILVVNNCLPDDRDRSQAFAGKIGAMLPRSVTVEQRDYDCQPPGDFEGFDGVVLSGVPADYPDLHGDEIMGCYKGLFETRKAVFGICFGARVVSTAFGGGVQRNEGQKGIVRVFPRQSMGEAEILRGVESFRAAAMHSHTATMPASFSRLAVSLVADGQGDGCGQAMIGHQRRPIFGVQFHPQASRERPEIIENFLKIIQKRTRLEL